MRSSEKTDFEVKMWRAAIMYLPYILYRPNVPYYLPCEHCLSLFCTSRILFSFDRYYPAVDSCQSEKDGDTETKRQVWM